MSDLISRQAAIDAFEDTTFTKNEILRRLEEIPTADVVERKTGKWKHDADGLVWCYECGFGKERSDKRPYNYCPNCGAKMEQSEE